MFTKINKNDVHILKQRGHKLKPIVFIGNKGLTPSVLKEIDLSLNFHELMKIRVLQPTRESRENIIGSICEQLGATVISRVGHIALLYRPIPKNE